MIFLLLLFAAVAIFMWPHTYRSVRSWRDGTLYPGDDPLSMDVRRREKVGVVAVVIVSLILAVSLIGWAMTQWL